MGSISALARDLARWDRQLVAADRDATWRDLIAFRGARATALHLMVDVRRDVAAVVGGRTLDSGKGRRARGYRAGVWAAVHTGGSGDWWVGGTGKLHWLDQGTTAHMIGRRRRGRRRKGQPDPAVLLLPGGPVTGPIRHPGARGSGVWDRSNRAHGDAAQEHGADTVLQLTGTTIPLLGDG